MKYIIVLFLVIISVLVGDIVQDSLVLNMDASDAGSDPDNYWRPAVGPIDGGLLKDFTDPAMGDVSHKPSLIVEPAEYSFTDADGFVWFYRFMYSDPVEGVHDGGGGIVGDLGESMIFDYYQDYTVEFWFRYPSGASTTVSGKGWLFSADNGSGFRFSTRTTSDGSRYFFELVHIYNGYENSYNLAAGMPSQSFDDQWHHVAIIHDGTVDQMPYGILYIDGERIVDKQVSCVCNSSKGGVCPPDWNVFNVLPVEYSASPAAIGGRCDYWTTYRPDQRYWWAGELSILRVYDNVLTESQVLQNFNTGIIVDKGYYCGSITGNLNGDCVVGIEDLAIICQNWLVTNWMY